MSNGGHGMALAAIPGLGDRLDMAHLRLQRECGWHKTYGTVTSLESLSAAALTHHAESGVAIRILPAES